MRIARLYRYPVKSMLGEQVEQAGLGSSGLRQDRELALIDTVTGLVVTAKHPRLWRDMLRFTARVGERGVVITAPDGRSVAADDPAVDELLSGELGRTVRLSSQRPDGATVERPDPEDVLANGVEAEIPAATLEIGQGTTGKTFVDYAPVHVISTATVDAIGTEHLRYRPNVVLRTPPGTPPFVENDWVGKELHVGEQADGIVLRVVLPTPRCAVPTLRHGDLPRAPHAVRTLLAQNRVDVPGFGVLPCAGGYAEVLRAGTLRAGDEVTVY